MASNRTSPTIDQLERASRLYKNNTDAARGMGIHPQTVTGWKKGARSHG